MSLNVLADSILDIEVSLIKKARVRDGETIKTEIVEIVPVALSALSKIVIEDSLTQHGLRGNVTIINKGGILSKLGITSGTPEDLYIRFNIIDKELEDTDVAEVRRQSRLSFLAMVKSTTTASANFEDNIVDFEFEEAVIAEMKYTGIDALLTNSPNLGNINVIDLVDAFYEHALSKESRLPSITLPTKDSAEGTELIELVESYGFSQQDIEESANRSLVFSDTPDISIPYLTVQDITQASMQAEGKDSKVFDIFKRLLKKSSASTKITARGSIGYDYVFPIFRFVNTGTGEGTRYMQYKALITDRHRQFLKALVDGKDSSSVDYADVYLEKFTIGPLTRVKNIADKNTNWHNYIEAYNIERPDVGTLREERWGNYYLLDAEESEDIKPSDIASVTTNIINYADSIHLFFNNMLAPDIKDCGVNLPLLKYETLPRFFIYRQGDYLGARQTMVNEALYQLISSFVTVNEQLHFTVKGRLYRQPGKFIIVDRGEDEGSILKTVWLVSSVTHNIENGEYTTDFICNRFFGDKDKETVRLYMAEAGRLAGRSASIQRSESSPESSPQPAWYGQRYDIGF